MEAGSAVLGDADFPEPWRAGASTGAEVAGGSVVSVVASLGLLVGAGVLGAVFSGG